MRRFLTILTRTLLIVFLLLAVVYAGEDISIRYRVPKGRNPFGTISTQIYYAVTQKNRSVEFYFDPPKQQVCVRSIFPHLGYPPCWYLSGHRVQRINM